MPKIIVDGESFEVAASNNLLEALLNLDKDLPYFCWHPSMGSVGACRQCAVIQYRDADDERGRIVMACMTPVTEGALFSMESQNARDFRSSVIENLMINHPHDCPVCEEGGECHLQDMTVMVGHRMRDYRGLKRTFRNQYLGPFINHEMNRCITCYRCVRYYQEYAGGTDLAAFASKDNVYFGRHEDGVLESEFAGNLVEVCPTGVFTDRPLAEHYTRKWDLQSAPSICIGCSLGCNTSPGERYGELRRIHNRYNGEVNGYFLCDRGRFGGHFTNNPDRIPSAGQKNSDGKYEALAPQDAISKIARLVRNAAGKVVGIGSPRATIESNYLLRQLVGSENYYRGMSKSDHAITNTIAGILAGGNTRTPTLAEVESADAILILGEDVTNTSPRLALSLRQSVRTKAHELANQAHIPLWQDAAVRTLAQDAKSPLYLLTIGPDRLADVAIQHLQLSPNRVAQTGAAIAHKLDNRFAAPAASSVDQALVDEISQVLKAAKRPLIISGCGAQSELVVQAAANVAWALDNPNGGVVFCLPECNSMGVTLLDPADDKALAELLTVDTSVSVAIVVENDLSRRMSEIQFETLLSKIDHLVVIDSLDNRTASASDFILAASTFAEQEGTLVNNEGRAQRSFAVFSPKEGIKPSSQWLLELGAELDIEGFDASHRVDDIVSACARSHPNLAGIEAAAPSSDFRNRGMKVARMTQRYSGRTAMRADISVHEPQQPLDDESALSYSMEGLTGQEPAALTPYVWSPGWNSNQSSHKFQAEIAGPLRHGDPGVRLLEPAAATELHQRFRHFEDDATDSATLLPRYHIFGSDELSGRTPAIAERCPGAYVEIDKATADGLGVDNGDGVEVNELGAGPFEVVVNPDSPANAIGFPVGLKATNDLCYMAEITLKKAENWTRRSTPDNLITSDK